jgi:hypothetical protein
MPGKAANPLRPLHNAVRLLLPGLISGLMAFSLASCSKRSESLPAATEQKSVATKPAADPQPLAIDACSFLSAEDATRILGARVRPTPSGPGGCSYEEKPPGSEQWESSVSLRIREYGSATDEDSAWDDLKLLRSLHPGRKNLSVLTGMGKEAYLENVPDHNAVDVSVIVHNEKSDFELKEVTDHKPATEVLENMSQRIAGKLP